jgi:hypothetical protein
MSGFSWICVPFVGEGLTLCNCRTPTGTYRGQRVTATVPVFVPVAYLSVVLSALARKPENRMS